SPGDPTQPPVVIDDPAGPPSPTSCTRFGEAVGGTKDRIIVGDRFSEYALVFDRTGKLLETLRPNSPALQFGLGVAIGDGIALIRSAGVVHWFYLDPLGLELLLTGGVGPTPDFGEAMAITRQRVFVTEGLAVNGYDAATGSGTLFMENPFVCDVFCPVQ